MEKNEQWFEDNDLGIQNTPRELADLFENGSLLPRTLSRSRIIHRVNPTTNTTMLH